MTACGIAITNRTANIVVLSGNRSDAELRESSTKLSLEDHRAQDQIKEFCTVFQAMCRELQIEQIGIRSRATKGVYAGGPLTFKIEGLIQLSEVPVQIIYPATIVAATKTGLPAIFDSVFKYQQDAFKVAYTILSSQ